MKSFILVSLLLAAVLASAAEAQVPGDAVTLRMRFGMKDAEGQDWSGSITATPGKVAEIRGWRWTPMDKADGSSWTVRTRPIPAQSSAQREKVRAGQQMPIGDNGVIITLAGVMPSSEIVIATKSGEVKFKLSDLPYGKRLLRLEGNLEIERAPAATAIAQTPADEDYPAAVADKDGNVYVAYVAFTRGKDFPGTRETLATPEVKPRAEDWRRPGVAACPQRRRVGRTDSCEQSGRRRLPASHRARRRGARLDFLLVARQTRREPRPRQLGTDGPLLRRRQARQARQRQ